MFLVKNSTAIGLALILLFKATVVSAIDDIDPLTGLAGVKTSSDSEMSRKLRSGSGNPIAGDEKSQLCQGCHGEFGNSMVGLIPKLAGQYAGYIAKQVRNYQAGTRSHQIMNAMAGTINKEEDLADIAAYFASQPRMKGDGSEENQQGKYLYLHGDTTKMRLACVLCHGKKGKGTDPKVSMFPVIGGQHKDYIRKQLVDFRSGFRTNSPKGIMNTVAKSLTNDEIEALAEYVSKQ